MLYVSVLQLWQTTPHHNGNLDKLYDTVILHFLQAIFHSESAQHDMQDQCCCVLESRRVDPGSNRCEGYVGIYEIQLPRISADRSSSSRSM